jgi:hypothetical protein
MLKYARSMQRLKADLANANAKKVSSDTLVLTFGEIL